MVRFATKTLLSDRGKLTIAVVGVVFALVLANVQGGLFLGMIAKASLMIDNSRADIWIGHRGVTNPDIAMEIPQAWLDRVRGLPQVQEAEPYIIGGGYMQLPDGHYERVLIVGTERGAVMGNAWCFSRGDLSHVYRENSITTDELDGWKLKHIKIGDIVEIGRVRAKVVAQTRGILGFITAPYVFTSLESARAYSAIPEGYCSFYLVRARAGADLEELSATLRKVLPDLDVHTAADFAHQTRMYWILRTGLGMSFGLSTLLGLTVGLVVVAQSLYAFVLDHLTDYATLKAMGAEDRQIHLILTIQGLTIALVGTLIGTGLSFSIQSLFSSPYVTITVPLWLLLGSILLVGIICLLSSALPFRRIRRVDPVEVLQQ